MDVFGGQLRETWNPLVIQPSGVSTSNLTPAAGLPDGLFENAVASLKASGIDRMLVVVMGTMGQITATGCLPSSVKTTSSFDLYRSYQASGIKADVYGQTQVFGESVDLLHVSLVANASIYQAVGHRGSCIVLLGLSALGDDDSTLAEFRQFTETFEVKQ